jgi:type IV pilus assembly protein PilN
MLVEINLLPKKEPKNYGYLAIILTVFLLFMVAGIFIFWQGSSLQNRLNLLENQISTTKKLTETEQTKLSNNQASSSVAELEAAVNWADDEPLKAVPIIKQVTSMLPDRGFIQDISYLESGIVNLTVQFDTNRNAAYYLKTLLDSKWIAEVKLTSLTTSEKENLTIDSEKTIKGNDQYVPRYIGQYTLTLDRNFINKNEKEKATVKSQQGGRN